MRTECGCTLARDLKGDSGRGADPMCPQTPVDRRLVEQRLDLQETVGETCGILRAGNVALMRERTAQSVGATDAADNIVGTDGDPG